MNDIIKSEDLFKSTKMENKSQDIVLKSSQELPSTELSDENKKTSLGVIKEQTQKVLNSEDAIRAATALGAEGVKADFAEEAARINKQNIETAEKEFDTETRKLRLEQLEAELKRQHQHNMAMLEQNAKHQEMLDKRKKMEEKYGYLYEQETIETKDYIIKKDEKGNVMKDENGEDIKEEVIKTITRPKDFCYSDRVNRIRTFTRNISRLDTTVKKIIKWIFIIGIGTVAIILLKKFNVLQ